MSLYLILGAVACLSLLSLFFSCLTYSLRDLSRPRLADYLGKHNGDKWFDDLVEHTADLAFLTAIARQLCNILLWLAVLAWLELYGVEIFLRYVLALLIAGLITIFVAVTIPAVVAKYAGPEIVGFFAPTLYVLRRAFGPGARLMHGADRVARRALGVASDPPREQFQDEILSAIENGEKKGIVGEQEREMIESVIEFRRSTAGQIMIPRPQIVALEANSTLAEVRRVVLEAGFARFPVYEGSLDHIIGILHVRDLIRHVGAEPMAAEPFSLRPVMRPASFVPETKPLRDLLTDFRAQKSQIAIVLDEYGGVAGLVTIEDLLEELVGEISDEHEKISPILSRRLDDRVAEADASVRLAELNQSLGIHLPENDGYDTLGGFLSTSLGRIPPAGTVWEHEGIRYTVLAAEPQRIIRVKIELKGELSH
jgi:putative hemolysin